MHIDESGPTETTRKFKRRINDKCIKDVLLYNKDFFIPYFKPYFKKPPKSPLILKPYSISCSTLNFLYNFLPLLMCYKLMCDKKKLII